MVRVTVSPAEFTLVRFDAGRIAELVGEVADRVGFAEDTVIVVEVDESHPLGRAVVASVDPVTLQVQGGAFEDQKRPRTMSERGVVDVAGRLLFRAADRLDPAFADAPVDADLTARQYAAWDAYALGRLERAGRHPNKERRRYHFRLRHGFSDAADLAFDRLWSASGLSWADIDALSAGV
jgi:hypothetical protein